MTYKLKTLIPIKEIFFNVYKASFDKNKLSEKKEVMFETMNFHHIILRHSIKKRKKSQLKGNFDLKSHTLDSTTTL